MPGAACVTREDVVAGAGGQAGEVLVGRIAGISAEIDNCPATDDDTLAVTGESVVLGQDVDDWIGWRLHDRFQTNDRAVDRVAIDDGRGALAGFSVEGDHVDAQIAAGNHVAGNRGASLILDDSLVPVGRCVTELVIGNRGIVGVVVDADIVAIDDVAGDLQPGCGKQQEAGRLHIIELVGAAGIAGAGSTVFIAIDCIVGDRTGGAVTDLDAVLRDERRGAGAGDGVMLHIERQAGAEERHAVLLVVVDRVVGNGQRAAGVIGVVRVESHPVLHTVERTVFDVLDGDIVDRSTGVVECNAE